MNHLKQYNHIAAVRAALSWASIASTNAPLISFHKQLDRTARSNYGMPSSHKHTPPRSAYPVVHLILTRFAKVRYNASRGARNVPLKQLGTTTSAAVSAGYLRQLSKDNCKDQRYYATLKKIVVEQVPEIFQVRTLPALFKPTQFYPSKVELHSQQAFGKNNLSKSYTVVPVMTQITVIMWKLGYLDPACGEPAALATALPFGKTTHLMLDNLQRVNFSALKIPSLDHDIHDDPDQEKMILANKLILRNACLLHYGIDLGAV